MEKKSKKTVVEEPKKLPYEELEKLCVQLRGANNELYKRLQNAETAIAEFNEVGLLLDLLGKSEFFEESFIERISKKIQEIINGVLDKVEKENSDISN